MIKVRHIEVKVACSRSQNLWVVKSGFQPKEFAFQAPAVTASAHHYLQVYSGLAKENCIDQAPSLGRSPSASSGHLSEPMWPHRNIHLPPNNCPPHRPVPTYLLICTVQAPRNSQVLPLMCHINSPSLPSGGIHPCVDRKYWSVQTHLSCWYIR